MLAPMRAHSRPKPEPAPVITATLPLKSFIEPSQAVVDQTAL